MTRRGRCKARQSYPYGVRSGNTTRNRFRWPVRFRARASPAHPGPWGEVRKGGAAPLRVNLPYGAGRDQGDQQDQTEDAEDVAAVGTRGGGVERGGGGDAPERQSEGA